MKVISANTAALVVLAAIAAVALLKYAAAVFIPLVLAVLLALTLDPVVSWLERMHVPRVLGALIAMTIVLAALGYAVYHVSGRAVEFVDSLPATAQKLRTAIRTSRVQTQESVLGKIKEAAEEIDQTVAAATPGDDPPPKGVTKVQVEEPAFDTEAYLWSGSRTVVNLIGQASVVAFLAFFLLAAGDLYKRKLVRLSGPGFADHRGMVETLRHIKLEMERFLQAQVVTCSLVAVATWLALAWFGMNSAGMWGIAAGVLNLIPYFGPAVATGAITLAAFVQFSNVGEALLIGAAALTITSLEGMVLKPVLLGRYAGINNVTVFLGLLFWGWLWGAVGALLAVPMMMIVKHACQLSQPLRPFGDLLSDR